MLADNVSDQMASLVTVLATSENNSLVQNIHRFIIIPITIPPTGV